MKGKVCLLVRAVKRDDAEGKSCGNAGANVGGAE